jgi:hypothetical protein
VVCTFVDGRLSVHRSSACDFNIQQLVSCILFLGFPSTVLVDATKNQTSFRTGFVAEIALCVLSLFVSVIGSRLIISYQSSTCRLTAPKLWVAANVSIITTWTTVLLSSMGMIIATTAVLLSKKSSIPSNDASFKNSGRTFYGTL